MSIVADVSDIKSLLADWSALSSQVSAAPVGVEKRWDASAPAQQLGLEPMVAERLPPARIEAAFGALPASTIAPRKASELSQPTEPMLAGFGAPRGLRFKPHLTRPRLVEFVSEERWEGYVKEVHAETFTAVIYSEAASEQEAEPERVELDIGDVNALMRHLVVPGAVFFWSIGFQIDSSGQRIRQAIITFPMMPVRTKEDRSESKRRAEVLYKALGWGTLDAERPAGEAS